MKTRTTRGKGRREEQAITRTSGVRGGSPCIAGTGIRVADVVAYKDRLGYSPRDIVKALPHLTLPQVQAALDFYARNKEEIDEYIAEEDAITRAHVNPPVPRRER